MEMISRRPFVIGFVGSVLAGTIVLGSARDAGAVLQGATLVTCDTPAGTGGTDVGDAKFSPGLTTTEKKQTISSSSTVTNCTANEAALDEIASESKFGVTITSAAGRLPIAGASIKAKFTTYTDCLGLVVADPDETGEYPAYGTLTVKWLSAAATPVAGAKTTGVMAQLDATTTVATAVITGIATKGLGVGGDWSSTSGFVPVATDDSNGNTIPDFVDCAVSADPTAVAKLLDVTTVDGAGPELSLTLP